MEKLTNNLENKPLNNASTLNALQAIVDTNAKPCHGIGQQANRVLEASQCESDDFDAFLPKSPFLKAVNALFCNFDPARITFGKVSRHTYLSYMPKLTAREIRHLFNSCDFVSNTFVHNELTKMSGKAFMRRLFAYEKATNSKNKNHLMNLYVIMLPSEWNKNTPNLDFTDKFARAFADKFLTVNDEYVPHTISSCDHGVLPYFYGIISTSNLHNTSQKDGDSKKKQPESSCKYLIIFNTERFFNPKGYQIKQKYTKDIYFDTLNNVMCSENNPNAKLLFKKGDVKKVIEADFTPKTQVNFKRPTDKAFYGLLKGAKLWMADFYAKNGYTDDAYTPIFPRISNEKIAKTRKHDRKKVVIINNFFQKLEKQFHDFIIGMCFAGVFDNDMFLKIKNIAQKTANSILSSIQPSMDWHMKTPCGKHFHQVVSYGRILWQFKEDFEMYLEHFTKSVEESFQEIVNNNEYLNCF